jgi:hypothetical protein
MTSQSTFTVRTARHAAERQPRSLNLDREASRISSIALLTTCLVLYMISDRKGNDEHVGQSLLHTSFQEWTCLLQLRESAYLLRNCQIRKNLFAASAYHHHA